MLVHCSFLSASILIKFLTDVLYRKFIQNVKYLSCQCIYFKHLLILCKCNRRIVEEYKTKLMSLAILFHVLRAQHVSDINMSIIRSLRLFCWITTLVVLFLVRCVLEIRCGWVGVVSVLQAETSNTDTTPTQPHRISNTHRTKNNTTYVVI